MTFYFSFGVLPVVKNTLFSLREQEKLCWFIEEINCPSSRK
jgi:hypothetical protein